jgi:hypothetical protein
MKDLRYGVIYGLENEKESGKKKRYERKLVIYLCVWGRM